MRRVRIALPFVFSAVLLLLSYLSLSYDDYIWLVYLVIGFVIALLGVLLSTRD